MKNVLASLAIFILMPLLLFYVGGGDRFFLLMNFLANIIILLIRIVYDLSRCVTLLTIISELNFKNIKEGKEHG